MSNGDETAGFETYRGAIASAFKVLVNDAKNGWYALPTIDRWHTTYTGLVWVVTLVVSVHLLVESAEAVRELYIMPIAWGMAKAAGALFIGWWVSLLRMPVVAISAISNRKFMPFKTVLVKDAARTVVFLARKWPFAFAIPSFLVFMGMVNLYMLYGKSGSALAYGHTNELIAGLVALTVINTMMILAVAAFSLNPAPRIISQAGWLERQLT